ncbi:DUF7529 family protein [Salarchaeum japonicum]|uniref:Uncharacterized protein n=1 Tax=Salarchaeum japonicum TaxID=555573 RepID=A0AAV3SZP3_9EURY|nr:hypothetical protein [Salarchaeum japonicum]
MSEDVTDPRAGAWAATVEDMAATADAYDDAGWDTYEVEPGDTTLLATEDAERADLDVVVTGPDYETVTGLIEDGVSFTEYEVLTATEAGTVYVVVVMEDPDREVALLFAGMYGEDDAADAADAAAERGEFVVHLRGLEEEPVEFVYEDPGLFAGED